MSLSLLSQAATDVNESLARYSDMAFTSAFALMGIALLVSLVGYAKMRVTKVAARDAARERAANKHLVGVGIAGSRVDSSSDDSGSTHDTVGVTQDHSVSLTDDARAEATTDPEGNWFRLTQLFALLGVVFLLASVVLRGLATHRMPLGNMYEFVLMTVLFLMTAAVWFLRKPGYRQLWPFVLVPVLIMLAIAIGKLYTIAAPVMPALQSYWLPVHVTVITLGSGILMMAGVFSVAYLLRVWQPKGSEHGIAGVIVKPLPTAASIDRLAYYATIIGFPIFGVGIILGAVWAESAWGRFWGWDPKETVSFITWIVYAGYLHARATTGWGPKRAAWISLAGFAVMMFNLFFINMVVSGLHSYAGLN